VSEPADGTVVSTRLPREGAWLIVLAGEHDVSTAPRLRRETHEVWEWARHVVVDLSSAAFIDSSVITWLLREQRSLRAGSTLRVVEGEDGGVATRIIDALDLRGALACYPTRQQACTRRIRALHLERVERRPLHGHRPPPPRR
jgi:anti-anti-sigma factor